MIEKETWQAFRESGLLWWINRMLHLFGWAIVCNVEKDGSVSDVYPAKVKFRGFDEKTESECFEKLTKHIHDNCEDLLKDVNDE